MNDDELGRRLTAAFDAEAHDRVDDYAPPPAPRFAAPRRRNRARALAPLAAAAAVVAVGGSLLALEGSSSGGHGHHRVVAGRTTTSAHSTRVAGTPVHIRLLTADGATYGVGMPVVALLSRRITSGKALQQATTATANGKPITGAWYFETSTEANGYPIEAHWRPRDYWPAHVHVQVRIAARGLPAGNGLAFDDAATLDFTTGARTVAIVNDATHRMVVTSDGKQLGSYPVSLGASATPTSAGVKVIMQKGVSVCMNGPGYRECGVKYTQRLTYGGEYLHSAPWNERNIRLGIDSSNGCTNLLPSDARMLYRVFKVGDVVEYPDATGPVMPATAGYGDWNVPWRVWLRGGLVPTS